jgi:hypothetical protein
LGLSETLGDVGVARRRIEGRMSIEYCLGLDLEQVVL